MIRELEGGTGRYLDSLRRETLTIEQEEFLGKVIERAHLVKTFLTFVYQVGDGPIDFLGSKEVVGQTCREIGISDNVKLFPDSIVEMVTSIRIENRGAVLERLTIPEVQRYFNNALKEAKTAENALVEANLRLVIPIAYRYKRERGLSVDDLIQEGNIGLMKAASKFSWWKENKFDTYATWWIRQAVIRATEEKGGLVRLPVDVVQQIRKLGRVSLRYLQSTGRLLTEKELSELAEIPLDRVHYILELNRWFGVVYSLDVSVSEEPGSASIGDFVPLGGTSVEDEALGNVQKKEMKKVLEFLTPSARVILSLLFGLEDGISRTEAEVAEMLGITQQGVSIAKRRAIEMLSGNPKVRERLNVSEVER